MATLAQDTVAMVARAERESVRAEAGTIAAMDGLRGLSVTWIVLFHFVVLRGVEADPWAAAIDRWPAIGAAVRHGPFAVDLFFLISGFLLTLPWLIRARTGRPPPDTRQFYVRRVRRIAPAYYAHVFLLFVAVMPLLFGITYWRADLYVYLLNAAAHALFLHNTTPLTSGSLGVNGALWTLAVEAQFYALLPWMAPMFVRAPWRSLAAAVAVSAAWVAGARHGFDGVVAASMDAGRHWAWREETIRTLLAIQFPAFLAHFALGATLARAWLRWAPRANARHGAAIVVACVALLVIENAWDVAGEAGWLVSLAALGGVVLGVAIDRGALARRAFARGPLAFMGRVSYSAYLWHLPLLALLQRHAPFGPATFFPAYLASVVAVGWLSWRWLERPFMTASARAPASPRSAP